MHCPQAVAEPRCTKYAHSTSTWADMHDTRPTSLHHPCAHPMHCLCAACSQYTKCNCMPNFLFEFHSIFLPLQHFSWLFFTTFWTRLFRILGPKIHKKYHALNPSKCMHFQNYMHICHVMLYLPPKPCGCLPLWIICSISPIKSWSPRTNLGALLQCHWHNINIIHSQ